MAPPKNRRNQVILGRVQDRPSHPRVGTARPQLTATVMDARRSKKVGSPQLSKTGVRQGSGSQGELIVWRFELVSDQRGVT